MLGALRKGEEPGMADAPRIQLIAGCGDEALPDAAVPQIGQGRQRPEKSDTAPTRREIRSNEHTLFVIRSESSGVFSAEPAIDIVEVAPERFRVGRAEKGAEGNP